MLFGMATAVKWRRQAHNLYVREDHNDEFRGPQLGAAASVQTPCAAQRVAERLGASSHVRL
jgi:hypothetical protein